MVNAGESGTVLCVFTRETMPTLNVFTITYRWFVDSGFCWDCHYERPHILAFKNPNLRVNINRRSKVNKPPLPLQPHLAQDIQAAQ